MKLSSLFDEEHVLIQSGATGFVELLGTLLETMAEDLSGGDAGRVAAELERRERRRPSIVAERMCIAHLRSDEVKRFRAGLAVTEEPVAHPSDAGKKIGVVFVVLAPPDKNTLMHQTVAAIQRRLASKRFIDSVMGIRLEGRIVRLIEESGVDVKSTLSAGDIMEPIEKSVTLETGLAEAVAALAEAQHEGLPVLDDKQRLVGELTSREVLLLGMPKYMDLISDPKMLNEFEPFENYFSSESEMKVRDVCRRDVQVVHPSASIITVAHRMITENRSRAYVQDDEKVRGVVHRKSILARVLV